MGNLLDKIDKPSDLKIIKRELLPFLAQDIREKIINTCSKNGGHVASSLGTVELTIALHYCLNLPTDKIIWDVGHQAYAHKLLTGRKDSFCTLRQHGGISGFPKRSESEYDSFGVGHSSTAISAALGIAAARDLKGDEYKVVSVVGDGSLTGGMAFEALQNAGYLAKDMLVILNDNEMFISERVGALGAFLAKLLTLGLVNKFEKKLELFLKRIHFYGKYLLRLAKRFKVLLFPGMLFEEMGFAYFGPVDGHDLNNLIRVLEKVILLKGPIVLHVITKKGRGYEIAEKNPISFHGIGSFDISTGQPTKENDPISYTKMFGKTLVRIAEENSKIIAITAAMPQGTGLEEFSKTFPNRYFDVGIAEQHALTFAAGLATQGFRPVCAIYSTFLQRGFDQIIHDIALQNLPVIIALDRAGIVGEDGPTHHGAFDISYLRMIPNLVMMAPADENELQHMLYTATKLKGPVAIRYPRGAGIGVKIDSNLKCLEPPLAQVAIPGNHLAILSVGSMVYPSVEASNILKKHGISAEVINMRFIKPLDKDLLKDIGSRFQSIITVEENVIKGGFGSAINEFFCSGKITILNLGLPDSFIEHGSINELKDKYGLTKEKIAEKAREFLTSCLKDTYHYQKSL
ncbi:MAG: 1-deoxy-D-xylulose-5-phosphate synthase [bacterium]